jgi:hypothetical protein
MSGACTHGRNEKWYKIVVGEPEGDHPEDFSVHRTSVVKLIFNKYERGYRLDLFGWVWDLVLGSGEHSNEPLDSVKGGEFLYWLSDSF